MYDNMILEMNVIHAAWRNGCRKLEFLGSSCIYPRMAPNFTKPEGYGTPKDHSWEADNPFHPWQDVKTKNNAFGFRGGFIAEYDFSDAFGIFADMGLEAYRDNYNGLQPSKEDQTAYTGYAGFPLDLRPMLSLGVIFRINR